MIHIVFLTQIEICKVYSFVNTKSRSRDGKKTLFNFSIYIEGVRLTKSGVLISAPYINVHLLLSVTRDTLDTAQLWFTTLLDPAWI